jgi:hypothetical protein
VPFAHFELELIGLSSLHFLLSAPNQAFWDQTIQQLHTTQEPHKPHASKSI